MVRQRLTGPSEGDSRADGAGGYLPTLLRVLVTERHWQKFPTFERQFRRAAAELARQQGEPELAKVSVSARQFERWYSGALKTEPYPDACRVLEFMFGHPVRQLFAPAREAARDTSARSASPPLGVAAPADRGGGLLAASEDVRLDIADALTCAGRPDIDYLADGVAQHAVDCLQTPPGQMLRRLIGDYQQAGLLLRDRHLLRHQRDLYRVIAQLGVLIADELMVLGKPVHARSWHEMTCRVADDTGDDALRAHARALAAMLPLYYGDPAEAVRLARQAQVISSGRRHVGGALAAALEALACAQLGERESSRTAVAAARRSFESLEERQRAESVFGFSERRWRFYDSRTHSLLGDIPAAVAGQQRALDLYPPQVVGDRALLLLDRARCVVLGHDIADGLLAAGQVLTGLPAEHRTDIFRRYSWNVAAAVPARFRNRPDVAEYCELLRTLPVVTV
jgi:hypothetical protein